ncbi:CRISPR-associated protein Csx15 [Pseudomonas sivasensis]|uniref:CRISPR-associated protein Csx15 n=1 Tax=Pseudomonas sivasensis TaxID=1880678 RepID=UPI0021AAF2BC|nr:CRISPR-associated protein Csx15 [Pseudomonas sivasensis]MCT4497656.1 CRISPR-associated protein Csx15 [Pseudomonas sivasensis]
MSGILLNFSGHALSVAAEKILSDTYDSIFTPELIDFDFDGDAGDQLKDIFSLIPFKIDGSEPLTIIPPGQSTLAILLVGFMHGVIGHFPKLCFLKVNEEGLYLPKMEYEVLVQSVRSEGRKFRSELKSVKLFK